MDEVARFDLDTSTLDPLKQTSTSGRTTDSKVSDEPSSPGNHGY